MSSIFSTQKRHTFLRRKYCFLVAIALSPPVGRWEALMGRPPFCCCWSAIGISFLLVPSFVGWCCWCGRYRSSRHGRAWHGCGENGLGGRQAGGRYRRGWPTRRTLFSSFLPLLDFLQLLVNPHGDELHHHVVDA